VLESEVTAFIDAFKRECRNAYPDGASDESYSAIISQHHYDRLKGLIEDARAKGADIIEICALDPQRQRTLAPTIILGATSEMAVMQEEIFGPILPVIGYKKIEDAIAYVKARPRPLALYIFSDHKSVIELLAHTTSGNMTVNDTLLHYAVDDLPFGGVGPSGMGTYDGEEGFRSLRQAKGVFTQTRWNFAGIMRTPFGRMTDRALGYLLR
jgi:coniferyl-aldehyde dehydrogenase